MHIEMNVYESIVGTFLYILGKIRDGVKSQLDLLEMSLRLNLELGTLDYFIPYLWIL